MLDPKGKGMHKSKGNVIWTEDLLKRYNVDVVRYWVGTANWGEDLPFQEKDLVTGNRFITKLWNAARFCYQHLIDYDKKQWEKLKLKFDDLEIIDQWLIISFKQMVEKVRLLEKALGNTRKEVVEEEIPSVEGKHINSETGAQ